MRLKWLKCAKALFLVSAGLGTQVFAVPNGLNFQGRVLLPNGQPVTSSNVTFTARITSPGSEACTLFEETHVLNMSTSDGVFNFIVGAGTRTANDKGFTLDQVFTNSGTLSSLSCASGTSYAPSSSDARNIYISYDDGTGPVSFPTPYVQQAMPYALEAGRLAGLTPSQLLQVNSNTTQAKVDAIMAASAYSQLQALLNGTSTQYVTASGGNFAPSSNISFGSHQITNLASPSSGTDAANKNYCDGNIGGSGADSTLASLTTGDNGKVLTWNGSKWVASAPSSGITALTGDVTASGSGSVIATVASVGGSSAANVHAAELLTNAATSSNTASSIVKRDASGGFVAGTATLTSTSTGNTIYRDSGSKTVTLQSPTSLTNSYVLKLPLDQGGSNQVLSNDGSGNLFWASASSGSVTSVTASGPLASSGGATPNITITKADSTHDGYLAQGDWSTFNGKLGTTLTSGQIFVGNGSNTATAVSPSGDVSMTNAGSFTVNAIKGKSVSANPTTAGQMLRYDGTNWTPNFVAMTDLRSTVTGTNQFASTCGASQTLTYNSVGDVMSCQNISIASTQVTGLGSAATLTAGISANNLVQLDASAKLPAVDGSQLTNLSASNVTTGTLNAARLPSSVFVNGGNATGAATSLGNTDSQNLNLITNNAARVTVLSGGNVGIGTTSPATALDVSGRSDSLRLPAGTSIQRPAAPASGDIRYNTTTNQLEAYINGSWIALNTQVAAAPDWFSYRQVGLNSNVASGADQESYYVFGQAATHASNQTGTFQIYAGMMAMPFIVSSATNLDRLAFTVSTAGSTGSKIRIAIYTNTSGSKMYPSQLLLDAGEYPADVTGNQFITVSSALPSNSVIWGVIWGNSGSGSTMPIVRAIRPDQGQVMNLLGWNGTLNSQATALYVSGAYTSGTSFPATFPSGATRYGGNMPAIFMRFQ